MKMNPRLDRILRLAAGGEEISLDQLGKELGVSAMTVRRDLMQLEREGRVNRTHGGVVLAPSGVVRFDLEKKAFEMAEEKQAIGRAVAFLIRPGMAVCLDTGTTTLEVAHRVTRVGNLRVVTTSLAIASTLHACENIELILLGGSVRKRSLDMSGPITEENLRRFRVDMAVLGADAVGPEGMYTTDVKISRISQGMADAAARTVLAVDSSKFGRTAFVKCMDLSRVGTVVTDAGCPAEARAWLEDKVKDVVYAPVVRTGRERC